MIGSFVIGGIESKKLEIFIILCMLNNLIIDSF